MTSSKKQKTRESLLEAAWKRLERGDLAKLEDVAADVGVSRQSVYLHFGSRGGMLLALVEYIDQQTGLQERIRAVQQTDDPIELLKRTLGLMATYQSEIHGVAMALVHLAEHDEDVRAALEDRMQRRRQGLAAIVKRLAAAGFLRKGWSQKEIVDVLWEAGAPSSYQHLVVERGWKPGRYRDWLIWIAMSFVNER
ncbi:MAG: TetR/AcrR family transcriptional regulator [Polyangiaceae bacterium]|nr:TetR/AcrR family transcriptional regulator [Polyangiaceae bacterium]